MGGPQEEHRRREGGPILAYVDSSAALRYLFQDDVAYQQVQACRQICSSELLEVECRRVLWRDRLGGVLRDSEYLHAEHELRHLLDEMELIDLDLWIKKRAMEAFPVHLKTLDALHLATALAMAAHFRHETVAVFSYDQTMNRAAKAVGLAAPWIS